MTVEEAINTALEYEHKVRDAYIDAVRQAKDEKGKKFFQVLASEEVHHVEYLEEKLGELKETGKVTTEGLKTHIPSKEKIAEAVAKMEKPLEREDRGQEMEMLRKALALEEETSGFYKRMVGDLPVEARPLFSRFVEIEEGHLAIVQAELDYSSGAGFWFDTAEFSLEQERE
jgi:rubrerythrin